MPPSSQTHLIPAHLQHLTSFPPSALVPAIELRDTLSTAQLATPRQVQAFYLSAVLDRLSSARTLLSLIKSISSTSSINHDLTYYQDWLIALTPGTSHVSLSYERFYQHAYRSLYDRNLIPEPSDSRHTLKGLVSPRLALIVTHDVHFELLIPRRHPEITRVTLTLTDLFAASAAVQFKNDDFPQNADYSRLVTQHRLTRTFKILDDELLKHSSPPPHTMVTPSPPLILHWNDTTQAHHMQRIIAPYILDLISQATANPLALLSDCSDPLMTPLSSPSVEIRLPFAYDHPLRPSSGLTPIDVTITRPSTFDHDLRHLATTAPSVPQTYARPKPPLLIGLEIYLRLPRELRAIILTHITHTLGRTCPHAFSPSPLDDASQPNDHTEDSSPRCHSIFAIRNTSILTSSAHPQEDLLKLHITMHIPLMPQSYQLPPHHPSAYTYPQPLSCMF